MAMRPDRTIATFQGQRPEWSADGDGVEHATITVPLDYTGGDGDRLSIALSRLRARDPSARRGVLLALNGGPGGYYGLGRRFPAVLAHTPPAERYDVIGFDPRGTGASTPLLAEITETDAEFDSRPPDDAFATIAEDFRRREDGARRLGGLARRHFHTRNIARDMEVIRGVLGEETINYLGYTYGTYLGAVYGSMFGRHLDRCVLDSCVHPDWSWREQLMAQGPANRANVEEWAGWTARRNGRFGLGTSRDEVVQAVEEAAAKLAAGPNGVRIRSLFDGAMGSRSADRARWEDLGLLVAEARAGDLGAARERLADERVWPPAETEGATRCGVLDAVTLEKDWPTDLRVYYDDMRTYRERYPYGYGVLRAQPWVGAFRSFTPPEKPTVVRNGGHPPGLVVRSDGDPIDHPDGGAAMAERLGHRLVTVRDSGQHEIYAFCRNPHVDAAVDAYLLEGELPEEDLTCPGTVARPDVPADTG